MEGLTPDPQAPASVGSDHGLTFDGTVGAGYGAGVGLVAPIFALPSVRDGVAGHRAWGNLPGGGR